MEGRIGGSGGESEEVKREVMFERREGWEVGVVRVGVWTDVGVEEPEDVLEERKASVAGEGK